MQFLFEYSDVLQSPYEAFTCGPDTTRFPVRAHWHYFMEIIYLKEGIALVECDGEDYVLEKGDMIMFHPEAVHAIYATEKQPPIYDVLKFDVGRLYTENSYAPKLRVILKSAKNRKEAPIFLRDEEICKWNFGEIIRECQKEIKEREYGYDIIVHNKICLLLMQIIRIWRSKGFDTDMAAQKEEEAGSVYGITEYIDAHIGENLKVEELAKLCNMSYSYFAKCFRKYYGRSCKEYIEFIRICKAEDLLRFTDFDMTQISQETGFSDSSHFIKAFRARKGITPKQYRMRNAL